MSKNKSQVFISNKMGLSPTSVSKIINEDKFNAHMYAVGEDRLMRQETMSYRELYRSYGSAETVGSVRINNNR